MIYKTNPKSLPHLDSIKRLPATQVSLLLRVLNIGNAALLGFSCFMAYGMVNALAASGEVPITRAFLATYMGMFAAMLALFETRVKYTASCIRKNFGFLFTYTGRAVFLIFLGAICFGMLDDDGHTKAPNAYITCLLTGLATVFNAILNCFIICNHPEFQAMNAPDAHQSPHADPSKMTDEQIKAYLAAHPEVAVQISGAGKDGGNLAAGGAPQAQDWARGESYSVPPGVSASSATSGGGGGGFFGFGGGSSSAPGGSAHSAPANTSSSSSAYAPPIVPARSAAVPASASYQPPSLPVAPPPPSTSFAIAGDDDNPFASNDNPFEKR